jgi:hypothetical protein
MLERNRDILKHAIKTMPGRKPKASGWEGISGHLDKIDAGGPLLEQQPSLPAYKAPAGAWYKIAASLPAAPFSFLTTIWGKMIVGAVFTASLFTAYYLIQNREPETSKGNSSEAIINTEFIQEESKAVTESTSLPPSDPAPDNDLPEMYNTPSEVSITEAEEKLIATETKISSQSIKVQDFTANKKDESHPQPSLKASSYKNDNRVNSPDLLNFREANIFIPDQERIPEKRTITNNDLRNNIAYARDLSRAMFKAGIFYSYKFFREIDQEGMSIPSGVSSFGLDLSYERNKWVLRTGVEYMGWKEKGIYTFDYEQNQLVYEYNYVDSAYVDPGSGFVTYFTTPQHVYDSVPGSSNDQVIYEYRILQIPLIAGYKFFERKNFSAGILGGVGIDIRLAGKQFIPLFKQEDATLNETSSTLKYRTNNNWRLIVGLEVAYTFSRKWEIYAEPGYQWYMKPLYAPDNTKGIGLLNIKFGLRYIF